MREHTASTCSEKNASKVESHTLWDAGGVWSEEGEDQKVGIHVKSLPLPLPGGGRGLFCLGAWPHMRTGLADTKTPLVVHK